MGDESTRWTVVVSKETDIKLRTRLAEWGVKKGGLSKFVEDAVKRQLFERSCQEFGEGFKDMSSDEVEELVDEAVAWARGKT